MASDRDKAFMLDQVVTAVGKAIVDTILALGYFGVLSLMALESACIPLPSEVIMPFAGYLASTGQFSLLGAATIGALGCNLGSTIAYYIAAKGGRKAIDRWGVYVLIRPSDVEHAERFFERSALPPSWSVAFFQSCEHLYRCRLGLPGCRCSSFNSARLRVLGPGALSALCSARPRLVR
jgi:membrane protein YqaA with SNARE-associated domain